MINEVDNEGRKVYEVLVLGCGVLDNFTVEDIKRSVVNTDWDFTFQHHVLFFFLLSAIESFGSLVNTMSVLSDKSQVFLFGLL